MSPAGMTITMSISSASFLGSLALRWASLGGAKLAQSMSQWNESTSPGIGFDWLV